jgi:glycosyltransferase involved in cell wall biosynthesis
MRTILATVYAVNPNKGSEDGMGWNYIMQIARNYKVYAVTRENNRAAIEQYMKDFPNDLYANVHFLYYDLPYWMRFWKSGKRGAMLYYLMWQAGMPSFISRQNIHVDLVHNLNFNNDWSPSYLWKLKKPFVWGPIGHHPKIPIQYLRYHGLLAFVMDRFRWAVKNYFWKFSPTFRKSMQKADYIWCMNSDVEKFINLSQKQYHICPSVATQDEGVHSLRNIERPFTLISAGRLVPLKGFDLTIRAYLLFLQSLSPYERKECKLYIIGSGPQEKILQQLVQEANAIDNVVFIKWIERKKLMEYFRTASVFIFPSHEGAGMVVPEALSFGLPVICLDNCGPGELVNDTCAYIVPEDSYDNTVLKLSEAIQELYRNPAHRELMSSNARLRYESLFQWHQRGDKLHEVYSKILG